MESEQDEFEGHTLSNSSVSQFQFSQPDSDATSDQLSLDCALGLSVPVGESILAPSFVSEKHVLAKLCTMEDTLLYVLHRGDTDRLAVLDVTADTWQREVAQATGLVAVDFWHEACTWCRRIDPVYKELANEYAGRLKLTKFNVLTDQRHTELASQYGILGTPTIIFFCNGRPVGELVGYRPKEVFKRELDDALAKFRQCLDQSTPLKQ